MTRRFARCLDDRTELCLALLGVAITLAAYSPGAMSIDSAAQLTEARLLNFSDAHPPALALLWHAVEFVFPGPAGILVIQAALVWGGLYLIARRSTSLVLLVGLLPPVFSILGAIWKDIMMAGALLVAFGLAGRSRWFWVVLAFACLTRHNAIFAVPPALALHLGRRPLAIVIATVLLEGFAMTSSRLLTDRPGYPSQILALFDVSGIASIVGEEPVLPSCFRKAPGSVRESYDSGSVGSLIAADAPLTYCYSASEVEVLLSTWVHAIRTHPSAYLEHRRRVAAGLLGFSSTPGDYLMVETNFPPEFFPHVEVARRKNALDAWFRSLEPLGVFRPWPYALIALACLVAALVRQQPQAAALAASGLCYEAALLLLAPSIDYRYSHWLIVSALVAGASLAVDTRRSSSWLAVDDVVPTSDRARSPSQAAAATADTISQHE